MISRAIGRPVPTTQIKPAQSLAAAVHPSRGDADILHVYRPRGGAVARPGASGAPVPVRGGPAYGKPVRGPAAGTPRPRAGLGDTSGGQIQRVAPAPRADSPRWQQREETRWEQRRAEQRAQPRPQPQADRTDARRDEPRPGSPQRPIYFGGVPSKGIVERNQPKADRPARSQDSAPKSQGSKKAEPAPKTSDDKPGKKH
jgi:hypothetical protein